MTISGATLWTGPGLAIVAALVGLGFLLLGRRSAPRTALLCVAAVVVLSGATAGVRLVEVQPTHALLVDSEPSAPQSTVSPNLEPEPGPGPGPVEDAALAGEPATPAHDDAVGAAVPEESSETDQEPAPDEGSTGSADASAEEEPASTPEQPAP